MNNPNDYEGGEFDLELFNPEKNLDIKLLN